MIIYIYGFRLVLFTWYHASNSAFNHSCVNRLDYSVCRHNNSSTLAQIMDLHGPLTTQIQYALRYNIS